MDKAFAARFSGSFPPRYFSLDWMSVNEIAEYLFIVTPMVRWFIGDANSRSPIEFGDRRPFPHYAIMPEAEAHHASASIASVFAW